MKSHISIEGLVSEKGNIVAHNSSWIQRIVAVMVDKAVMIIYGIVRRVLGVRMLQKSLEKDNSDKKVKELEINNENLRFLLGQKLSFLSTVSNVCMSWWVSSIVFCGSILAGVWINRDELVHSGIISILGFVIAFFFYSFIWFGNSAINYLTNLQADILPLIEKLKLPEEKKTLVNIFDSEIAAIKNGIKIGKWTFWLILGMWIVLIITLRLGYWKLSG